MTLAGALVVLASLVVSSAVLLVVVALVWYLDRYDREPLHMVVGVFLWGAAAAPVLVMFTFRGLEVLWPATWSDASTLALSSIATPVVEEISKAIGVILVVALTRHFDNPTDGFVYGTAVGLGFAVTENYLYFVAAGTQAAANPADLVLLAAVRTGLSAGTHALASAAFGGFLGHAVLSRRPQGRLLWLLVGLAAATLIHGLWNASLMLLGAMSPDGRMRPWLIAMPVLYLFYVTIFAAFLRSEHRILKLQLAEEVELSLVPPWVAEVIPYYRRRVRGDWWPERSERTVISRLLTRMAFRKHALRNLPPDQAAIASLEVVRIRQRIRRILTPEDVAED